MTEYPILFNGEMVRAQRAGLKTQTRRVIKTPKVFLPRAVSGDWPVGHHIVAKAGIHAARLNPHGAVSVKVGSSQLGVKPGEFEWHSPYGRPGDRLWVRETWAVGSIYDDLKPSLVHHGAKVAYAASGGVNGLTLRPSIFMPRWASRTNLEVVNIRVERVQDISESDAKAEGARRFDERFPDWPEQRLTTGELAFESPFRSGFAVLWDELNADRGFSWMSNPFVWAVDFKPIEEAPGL